MGKFIKDPPPTTFRDIERQYPELLEHMLEEFAKDRAGATDDDGRIDACIFLMDRYASAWLETKFSLSRHGFDPKEPLSAFTYHLKDDSHQAPHNDAKEVWDRMAEDPKQAIRDMSPFLEEHEALSSGGLADWLTWSESVGAEPRPLVKAMAPVIGKQGIEDIRNGIASVDQAAGMLKPYINRRVKMQ